MNINNLLINGNYYKKKKFILCTSIVLMGSILVSSIFGRNNKTNIKYEGYNNNNISYFNQDVIKVKCNFYNLKDDNFVIFQDKEGVIKAIISANSDGSSSNLIAYLEPGNYYVISNYSSREQALVFDIDIDINDNFEINIDCNSGEIALDDGFKFGR